MKKCLPYILLFLLVFLGIITLYLSIMSGSFFYIIVWGVILSTLYYLTLIMITNERKKKKEKSSINKFVQSAPVIAQPISVVSQAVPPLEMQEKKPEISTKPQIAAKDRMPRCVKSAFQYMGASISSNGKNVLSMNRKDKGVDLKSAFTYKGATIQYKIKVENQTSEPIADIKINLYVPDVFILSESTKSITIIKPSESKTVTFEIRPTGECGDCQISGKVVYYDYKTKKTTEATIPPKNVSIICPILRSKEISESEWRNTTSVLKKAEETSKEIDIPASTLFDVITDVLQDMNLFMLDPRVNGSGNLYRAVSKFYGEGVKSLKYAAQVEVVGGSSKSNLILKVWAESEDALTGFYHGILDEIEKRVHVKDLIDITVVNNYHYGDNVVTQVKDSVVQRSTIGTSKDKCTGSEKECVKDEKSCTSCETAVD